MRWWTAIGGTIVAALLGIVIVRPVLQTPDVRSVDEKVLREYAGVYQWAPNAFVYLQMWNELTWTNQLVAFDESGEIRTWYPTNQDRFFAGPGAAVAASIESRIEFQRGDTVITALTWQRKGAPPRIARRLEIERHEEVRFPSGDIQLTGTLIGPNTGEKHPAIQPQRTQRVSVSSVAGYTL